jgi:hypothetical protein
VAAVAKKKAEIESLKSQIVEKEKSLAEQIDLVSIL